MVDNGHKIRTSKLRKQNEDDVRIEVSMIRRPTHPGTVLLEDVIKPLHFTITEAAQMLGVTRKTLSELVYGRISLSPEMTIRIGKAEIET